MQQGPLKGGRGGGGAVGNRWPTYFGYFGAGGGGPPSPEVCVRISSDKISKIRAYDGL